MSTCNSKLTHLKLGSRERRSGIPQFLLRACFINKNSYWFITTMLAVLASLDVQTAPGICLSLSHPWWKLQANVAMPSFLKWVLGI